MTFKIITLGCKVNTYESEVMQEKLIKAGYQNLSDDTKNSDIVIINTSWWKNTANIETINDM